jgi:hypothetical protein
MTTFTSDDREEAYKKINEDVVPIPFAGWVNTAPPHIVDSGASVMIKELTDVDIFNVFKECVFESGFCKYEFARAILRKAQEK